MRRLVFTIGLILSLGSGTVHAGDELREGFAKTLALCDSKWNAYQNGLDEVKKQAVRYISSLSQDDFLRLWDANDQLVVFISGTWPEILKYEPKGPWSSCVAQHTDLLRRQIADRSSDVKAREQFVKDWRGCVLASYDGRKVIKPFDRLAACYMKQARAFKE